jgi:hypothetical protein
MPGWDRDKGFNRCSKEYHLIRQSKLAETPLVDPSSCIAKRGRIYLPCPELKKEDKKGTKKGTDLFIGKRLTLFSSPT